MASIAKRFEEGEANGWKDLHHWLDGNTVTFVVRPEPKDTGADATDATQDGERALK